MILALITLSYHFYGGIHVHAYCSSMYMQHVVHYVSLLQHSACLEMNVATHMGIDAVRASIAAFQLVLVSNSAVHFHWNYVQYQGSKHRVIATWN
jgi:hypothetical protein